MTGQVVSSDGVKLAGNFNNFSTSIIQWQLMVTIFMKLL
jgi:hypothetical protein